MSDGPFQKPQKPGTLDIGQKSQSPVLKNQMTAQQAMGLAILEAHRGAGFVSPNPLVGCVILDEDGLLLSTGYHKKYGGAHAEIEALKGVSDEQLEGAHIYVTLEPCAHIGKTGACAEKLAKLPIASVTYGLQDPFPAVNGKGIEILKKAGKKVTQYNLGYQQELEELVEVFFHNVQFEKPFVALKVASSMDGQMGLKNGESQWITNEKSRTYAHYLRGVYDAVIVGKRTVSIDNPSLNIRHPDFKGKTNKVIIMDPDAELASDFKSKNIAQLHDPQHIYWVVNEDLALKLQGRVPYIVVPCRYDKVNGFDLDFLLSDLYKRGIHSVLLEGGSFLYRTFLNARAVQRIYHFQAPILIGAEHGLSWTSGFGIQSMKERIQLKTIQTHIFDHDILITGRLFDKTL